jgi:hypothetical protein
VWLLLDRHAARDARLEPAWVSPAYGVRQVSRVLIVEEDEAALPAALWCLFAESRLPDDQRQRALERLDARGARLP